MIDQKVKNLLFLRSHVNSNNLKELEQALAIAEEDEYLLDLMVDWADEVQYQFKEEMYNEIINYTEEVLRHASSKK